jgi:predicted TIM-barrel fold metal-dependent hydrolase
MIVDVHTHVPTHTTEVPPEEEIVNQQMRPDKPVRITTTHSDFFKAMEPVDRVISFGIAMPPDRPAVIGEKDARKVNNATAALVAQVPGKVIGFMSVWPDAPDALEEMERAYHDLKLRGLKLGPNYQNFDPLGENALRVYARVQEWNLPVLFHQGTSPIRDAPLRYAHPLVMDDIAIRFPELRIVMAHIGHPWQDDCLAVIRKHPHVYADVSGRFYRPWLFYNGLRMAYEWGVMDKLLLGSDYPITMPQEVIDSLRSLKDFIKTYNLPEVPQELLEQIIHRDALALLELN